MNDKLYDLLEQQRLARMAHDDGEVDRLRPLIQAAEAESEAAPQYHQNNSRLNQMVPGLSGRRMVQHYQDLNRK